MCGYDVYKKKPALRWRMYDVNTYFVVDGTRKCDAKRNSTTSLMKHVYMYEVKT
jgi:hypothetical protein